MSVFNWLTAKL